MRCAYYANMSPAASPQAPCWTSLKKIFRFCHSSSVASMFAVFFLFLFPLQAFFPHEIKRFRSFHATELLPSSILPHTHTHTQSTESARIAHSYSLMCSLIGGIVCLLSPTCSISVFVMRRFVYFSFHLPFFAIRWMEKFQWILNRSVRLSGSAFQRIVVAVVVVTFYNFLVTTWRLAIHHCCSIHQTLTLNRCELWSGNSIYDNNKFQARLEGLPFDCS